MKKRILSIALTLVLTLSLTVSAFAAGKTITIEYKSGTEQLPWPVNFEITNVTGQEKKDFSIYDPDVGTISRKNATVIYCDAPTTITFRHSADFSPRYGTLDLPDGIWVACDTRKIPSDAITWNYKKEGSVFLEGSSVKITKEGDYVVSLLNLSTSKENAFFIVVGDSSSSSSNTKTPTADTEKNITQKKPAPSKPADKNTVTVAGQTRTPGQIQNYNSDYLYTVKSGDTLYGLAERFYGNGNLWKKLQKANQEWLNETKDGIIFIGFNLLIPAELDGIRANIS